MACGQFDEALSSLREWLENKLPSLQQLENVAVYGDLETVSKLNDEHEDLKAQIAAHRATMNSVKERAQKVFHRTISPPGYHFVAQNRIHSIWEDLGLIER